MTTIAAGDNHTCGVTAGGTIRCWGRNDKGQLGDGTTDNHPVAKHVCESGSGDICDGGSPLGGMYSVAAGIGHTCALTSTGGVKCWGDNANGQIGDAQGCGTTCDNPVPVPGVDTPPATPRELAEHWAPIIYQDIDGSDAAADYITSFNFDGNWRAWDNWEHKGAGLPSDLHPLSAYVYYWVVETDTTWYLSYAFFHPRDWGGTQIEVAECLNDPGDAFTDPFKEGSCHENDMEGILVAVQRDGTRYGQFLTLTTRLHTNFKTYRDNDHSPSQDLTGSFDDDHCEEQPCFDPDDCPDATCTPGPGGSDCGDVNFEFDHPRVYSDAKGHAVRGAMRWEECGFPGGDGLVYQYTGVAEVPAGGTNVGYDLLSMEELFAHQCDPETFVSYGTFRGDKDFGNTPDNRANSPWGWSSYFGRSSPDFFCDPADGLGQNFGIGESNPLVYTSASFNPLALLLGGNCLAAHCGDASMTIDGVGGTVATSDGSVTVSVPPGALAGPTNIAIEGGSNESGFGIGSTSTNIALIADLVPEGVSFAQPVTVTFTWLDADDNGVVDGTNLYESDLRVFRNGVELGGTQRCADQVCNATACCNMVTNRWAFQVSQFSEYAVALEPCLAAISPKLTIKKVTAPPGDDGLTFTGSFTLSGSFDQLPDPVTNGAVLRLVDATGSVLYAAIPPGAYDKTAKAGWSVNSKGTQWQYKNSTKAPPRGITKVKLANKSTKTPGLMAFGLGGKAGAFGVGTDVRAQLLFPDSRRCVEARFPATPPIKPSCVLSGTTLKCK